MMESASKLQARLMDALSMSLRGPGVRSKIEKELGLSQRDVRDIPWSELRKVLRLEETRARVDCCLEM